MPLTLLLALARTARPGSFTIVAERGSAASGAALVYVSAITPAIAAVDRRPCRRACQTRIV